MNPSKYLGMSLLLSLGGHATTAGANPLQECLSLALQSATDSTTVGELRTLCQQKLEVEARQALETLHELPVTPSATADMTAASESLERVSAVEQRLALERYTRENPFVLTPHRANYVLPVVYSKDPNEAAFATRGDDFDFQHIEFQFQLSIKATVWENLFGDNGHLALAYTNRSFWQAYNSDISAPFRDTNHEPEAMLTFENDWEIFGFRNVANQVIITHQSNGRAGDESRSWNRVMLNAIFERDNFVMSIKPWYRLREDKRDDPLDAGGDDNPDIEKYLGHFEWFGTWQRQQNVYSILLRNNLRSDNRGAVELGWSFPLGGRFKGYVKYFNGYGESLIDYDQSTESFGIGVLISDWL